jgi:hypothetical protein
VASGGTGTATPGLVQGTNVTITGSWPNQTINAAGGGGGGSTNLSLGAQTTTTFEILSDTGSDVTIPAATTLLAGALPAADKIKLNATSGTNTGDDSPNSLYSGLVSNATHTGDATGSVALTLATVNSNVGSFGSATAAPTFTVNGKGLITAAGSATITPAIGSVTGLGTGVGAALGISIGSAGAPVLFNGAGGTPSSLTLTGATGLPLTTGVTGLLPVANGGTGTATPGLVQGTNITITGSWPNQTINASGAGGSLTVQDEGSTLSAAVTTLNFTGAGVTATGTSTVTVNVPTGSGGNVSNSGTPTSGQAAEWVTATTVQGVAVTGTGSYVKGTAPTITLPNATGLPLSTGIAGLGTGIATALAINTGSAGAPVLFNGAGGTPSGLTLTNATGLPLTTGVTGVLPAGNGGNATHTGDATGATALTLATVNSNVGSFGSATAAPTFTVNGKGLVTAAGSTTITPAIGSVTGLGTGIATALAANTGSAGAPVLFNGAGGTPSSLTLTSATGLPLTTGVTGLLPVANGGTGTATPGLVQGTGMAITGSWPNQTVALSALITGTATLGTSAITSGASATTVTVAAAGVLTTDVIAWGFNANPNSVTGYNAASTTGCLVVTAFPTAGNVNFVVSNPTAGSITPGALTLNWSIER